MRDINRASSDLSRRGSGVLLHVTSLPGPYGIGDLGPAAHKWVDALANAGQRWWQMLPLGPAGQSASPYQCLSSFAGNPLLISPDQLLEDGLLERADLLRAAQPPGRVDYPRTARLKWALLALTYARFQQQRRATRFSNEFHEFVSRESAWLSDYALFMAVRDAYNCKPWSHWPRTILLRNAGALRDARARLTGAIGLQTFAQYVFDRQLRSLRVHARNAGVALIGDLPIFVSPESCDVWKNPNLFQLDRDLQPRAVAGVPPDLFCAEGQRWGNPLYNWKEMAKDGYGWWKDRLGAALRQADVVRIDHFLGLEAYWSVPASAATAKTGCWKRGPGARLLAALMKGKATLPLLAEDLGLITPAVERLRDDFQLPGMRVLQFGLPAEPKNPHTPHNFIRHCFGYTGTHDNDTTAGWHRSLSPRSRRLVEKYAPHPCWNSEPSWAMIQVLSSSVAGQVIIPLQDLLNLGSEARMNTPGHHKNNWQWRCLDFGRCVKPLGRLAQLTRLYERRPTA